MATVYDHPRYYELAFSFRDIAHEVDLFEECIRRYSSIQVQTFLELASGNSPHMCEITSRGYRYVGLDINDHMIEFARRKIADPAKAAIIKGDMCRFDLTESVDFAFVSLGSLYARSTADLIDHFNSVGRAIRPGGLYLLDWCVYFNGLENVSDDWTVDHGDAQVHVKFRGTLEDPVEQIYREAIELEVKEQGRRITISGSDTKRLIYPQEFLFLAKYCTPFRFLGWWNNWDLSDPLPTAKEISRPICLLGRKEALPAGVRRSGA
jgi:SAM-dependent methyltransferase